MVNKFEFCKYFENCGSEENCSNCTAFKCSREKIDEWYRNFKGFKPKSKMSEEDRDDFHLVHKLKEELGKEEKAEEIKNKIVGKINAYARNKLLLEQLLETVETAKIDNKVFNKRITNAIQSDEKEYRAYFEIDTYSSWLKVHDKNSFNYNDNIMIYLENSKFLSAEKRVDKEYLVSAIQKEINRIESSIDKLSEDSNNIRDIVEKMESVYNQIQELLSLNLDIKSVLGINHYADGIYFSSDLNRIFNAKKYL